jgi:hypothetical protein
MDGMTPVKQYDASHPQKPSNFQREWRALRERRSQTSHSRTAGLRAVGGRSAIVKIKNACKIGLQTNLCRLLFVRAEDVRTGQRTAVPTANTYAAF